MRVTVIIFAVGLFAFSNAKPLKKEKGLVEKIKRNFKEINALKEREYSDYGFGLLFNLDSGLSPSYGPSSSSSYYLASVIEEICNNFGEYSCCEEVITYLWEEYEWSDYSEWYESLSSNYEWSDYSEWYENWGLGLPSNYGNRESGEDHSGDFNKKKLHAGADQMKAKMAKRKLVKVLAERSENAKELDKTEAQAKKRFMAAMAKKN